MLKLPLEDDDSPLLKLMGETRSSQPGLQKWRFPKDFHLDVRLEVRIKGERISGLYNPNIYIYPMYKIGEITNPLILTSTIDPS